MKSFVDQLNEAVAVPGLRKGERTRRRLRLAAAEALTDAPYTSLSVDGICAATDVSRTAFYVYYGTKADVTRELLTEFQRSVLLIRGPRESDPLAGIRAANRAYLNFVRLNAPLMERIRELRDEIPELIAERQRVNAHWAGRIVASARRHGGANLPDGAALLRAHALIFMVEDFLRELFVIRNPNLVGMAGDDALIVRELSAIWHGALFR